MRDSFPPAGHADPFDLGERLLTTRQVAARLGVSERWLRDHASRRNLRIPAIKLGPLVRFRWADVQAFIAKLETEKNFKRH
jgi:excisionase family DNA binding protein